MVWEGHMLKAFLHLIYVNGIQFYGEIFEQKRFLENFCIYSDD